MKTSSCRCRNLTAVVVNYCLGEAARRLRPSARCSAARRSPCLHTGDGSSVRPPARRRVFTWTRCNFIVELVFFSFFFFFQHTHSFLKTRKGRGKRRVVGGGGVSWWRADRAIFFFKFIYLLIYLECDCVSKTERFEHKGALKPAPLRSCEKRRAACMEFTHRAAFHTSWTRSRKNTAPPSTPLKM